jgi:exodeoxyribonuclease VIII
MIDNPPLPESLQSHQHVAIGDAIYFPDMDNAYYHQSPGVSSSTLRRFRQSQLHAMQEVVEPTTAMQIGSAAHSLIVEGENAFNKEVAVISGSPYTNANKQLKRDYLDRGMLVITQDKRDMLFQMKDNLIDEARKFLDVDQGEYPGVFVKPYENALYWWEQDVLLKLRSDVIRYPVVQPYSDESVVVIDYKTTSDCSVSGFTRSIRRYQYDLQAAFYRRGYQKAGFKVEDFLFVAQETKHPYATKIFKMNDEDMDRGWKQLEKSLVDFKSVKDGEKPSIYNSPNIVEVMLGYEFE